MKKYVAEFIGTFALVFCGTGAVIMNDVSSGTVSHLGVGITFGLIVMAMIYTFGKISGAHINPAVSIAFALTDKFSIKDLFPYILAQLSGAFFASGLLRFLFPEHLNLGATFPLGAWHQTFIIEIILTYILMLVIFFVSQNKETSKYTALAAGGVVGMEAIFAGPITGASMNPARSIAPAFVSGNTAEVWIYILAPIIGALLALFTWKYFREESQSAQ